MTRSKLATLATTLAVLVLAPALDGRARAADTVTSNAGFDLAPARALIKAKDWPAALTELRALAEKHQHADIYNLLGFSLRKSGDYKSALTYYQKALDYDPDHKSAHEYLGELYVETGQLAKAREHAAILARLCPQGCEERADLDKAIAKAAARK